MVTKEMIEPLLKEKKTLSRKILSINKAIKALQDICDHEFVDQGQDSHKTHHRCKICSLEESW